MPNIAAGFSLAFRARFGWLAIGAVVLVVLSAFLSAQFSGRQPATVAMDVGLSVIRLVLPLVLILMTQELLSREFDRRYFLSTFSYPCSRNSFLLGRIAALVVLVFGLLSVTSIVLALLVWLVGHGYSQSTPVALGGHYFLVVAFIGLDLLLLAAIATLLAVVASTPSFVLLGTFGFMLVARSFGAVIELLTHNGDVVGDAESYRIGIGALGYLLPDLGALDIRTVALYGQMELLPSDWRWLVLSSLIYALSLLALAVWALLLKRVS